MSDQPTVGRVEFGPLGQCAQLRLADLMEPRVAQAKEKRMREFVANAVNSAVAAGRDRCAKIAEELPFAPTVRPNDVGLLGLMRSDRMRLAAKIREGGNA